MNAFMQAVSRDDFFTFMFFVAIMGLGSSLLAALVAIVRSLTGNYPPPRPIVNCSTCDNCTDDEE